MATLKELYTKIVKGYYNVEDVIEFVALAAEAINPSIPYNPQSTVILIQSGFMDAVLPNILNAVESNPDKVGFRVVKVWSKPNPLQMGDGRTLLKINVYDN